MSAASGDGRGRPRAARPSRPQRIEGLETAPADLEAATVDRLLLAPRSGPETSRGDLLGQLSHELRTPIATIYGGTKVLARFGASLPEQTRDELVGAIEAEAERLYRLVEDLLAIAATSEGVSLAREPVLVHRVLPRIVEGERRRRPDIEVRVSLPSDLPAVIADPDAVRHIVRNLVENAVDASPQNGTVAVEAEADERSVVLRVLDAGPALDPTEPEQVWGPFVGPARGQRLGRRAGLALTAVARLVESLGGSAWAAPAVGGGTEFGIRLPASRG
ncbi:MAG TPA: ATP-binding protein [Candidatus Limnocylindrales bacterium]|nr:ATP-binding protein [Candidatus Limnocylindrales bacterium]